MQPFRDNLVRHAGFTLVELLTVIGILLVLVAIALPAVNSVRNAARTSTTTNLVQGLQVAVESYVIEDRRHLPPPMEADLSLRAARDGEAPRTLDLLRSRGMEWRLEMLGPEEANGRPLVDGWKRMIRYQPDTDMDRSPDRPAPRDDWNAKGREPFAYLWSLGKPSGAGDAADADPSQAERWIYTRSSP
ncbi:MAG: type II secretion system protein [Planctomycetes bacterium]|nr:type II secretion system protein [Planctomycetota bacterium]